MASNPDTTTITMADIEKVAKGYDLEDLKTLRDKIDVILKKRAQEELAAMYDRENDLRLLAGMKRKPGGTGRK